MEKISIQSIFNAAWQAFIVEGKPPSADDMGSCKYRGPNGGMCAVGLCLPDGVARRADKSAMTLAAVVRRWPDLFVDELVDLASDDESALTRIQLNLHDTLQSEGQWEYSPSQLRARYERFAKKHNLTIPTV